MDLAFYLWLSGFISGTAYLSITYRTEFAFSIPFNFACITLAVTGLTLILAGNLSARFSSASVPPRTSYIPLNDFKTIDFDSPHRKASISDHYVGTGFRRRLLQRRQAWALLALFVVVVCSRLELARRIIAHNQCATLHLAPIIPFLVVHFSLFLSSHDIISAVGGFTRPLIKRINSTDEARFFLGSIVLAIGGYMTLETLPSLRSNYICNRGSFLPYTIPSLQVIAACLDAFLIILVECIVTRGNESNHSAPALRLADPGWAALVAYAIMTSGALLLYRWLPVHRYWYAKTPGRFFTSALRVAFVFAFTSLSGLQLNRRIGFEMTTTIATFIALHGSSFATARSLQATYIPSSAAKIILSLYVTGYGFTLSLRNPGAENNRRFLRWPRAMTNFQRTVIGIFALLAFQIYLWSRYTPVHHGLHPIHSLMTQAEQHHGRYLIKSATSNTLSQAAEEYRRRYGRDPPPRFDRWFRFATERDSLILDDFDNMYDDLTPLWSLSPGDIRLRVWESIANPWNDIGGITIRKGQAFLLGHPPESHRWMLEGVMNMTQPFVKWLPDMDLAFNFNDEPRSAMAWEEVQGRLAVGRNINQLPPRDTGDFEADRRWIPMPQEPLEDSRYREGSFHDSFYRYGVVGCHKSTKARRERHWQLREACASCLAEHSKFHFVTDWKAAGDPCHQPDVADIYGLHSSPSTFKGTNELMPVFSQSKAYGYNDLLYPSPWTYMNKTMYAPNSSFPDPSFDEKRTTLFWRGGTSEGKSTGSGAWKGMARQRLLHLFNNATENEKSFVLLPTAPSDTSSSADEDATYKFEKLSPSKLHDRLSTDVYIVNNIDRCANRDCLDQHAEFHPEYSPSIDFQQNWRYKYLIDMDGAGFSGRFIPFLQSHSVPFKAGLAREWWEPRVTPWLHFVPMDIRLTEAWSLLAYFAGWKLKERGDGDVRWLMPPHDKEAEKIAEAGRAWAAKALRREDMEIYMFRLLLEYGRVSDDRRDELGWTGDKSLG